VPLTAELAKVLRDRCRTARGAAGWVFANGDGELLGPCALRFPLRRALARAGITKRVTVHGLRRTFNNLSRQVAGNIVTRAITGHVTEEMTEHYSHVDRAEKLRAADQVVALAEAVESGLHSPWPSPADGGGDRKGKEKSEGAVGESRTPTMLPSPEPESESPLNHRREVRPWRGQLPHGVTERHAPPRPSGGKSGG